MRQATRTTSTDTKEREVVGSDALDQVTESATRAGDQASLRRVVQAKMAVSSPSDSFEIEADRVADDFVSRSYASINRRIASTEVEEPAAARVSRRAMGDGLQDTGAGLETSDETAAAISRASSGGNALDPDTKNRFEDGLGADLSNVRIHADGQSDTLCRSLSAEAFTTGSDVFFSSGAYKPGTRSGDHLLAHELTHVVQQGSAPVIARSIFSKSESEKKADEMRKQRKEQKEAFAAQKMTKDDINEEAEATGPDNAYEWDEIYGPNNQVMEVTNQSRDIDSVRHTGEGASNPADLDKANGVIGVASSTKALITSILALYKAIKSDETDTGDKVEAAADAASKALSVAENAIKVATSFGGSIGTAVVPGIGIAVSAISAGQEILNIYRANRDIKAMEADRDSTTDENKRIAVDNLISRRKRGYYGAIVNLIGDITMLIGNIGVVATGPGAPWALIVVASGALIKGFSAIGQAISRWVEAHYTNKAREGMASAQEQMKNAKTDEEKATAKKNLEAAEKVSLQDDATYAASYILEKAVAMKDEKGEFDPQVVKIISVYGLGKEWLADYEKSPTPVKFEEGVDKILETVGTSRNPKGFIDSLKATMKSIGGLFVSFWNFITGKKVVDGNPEESPIRIKLKAEDEIFDAIVSELAKYSATKPPVASKISDKLTKTYKALLATFAPEGYKNKKKAADNAEIIRTSAIDLIMSSDGGAAIDPATIDIKDAKLVFKVKSAA